MQKKLLAFAGLLVAAFMLSGVVAPKAQAATAAELEAQVQALLAQIAQLQGSGAPASCYAFIRPLTVGAQGADVTALQNFLAAKGYFSVAATGFFGPITQKAVAAWQAANGVMPSVGYFGPLSQAKYSSMCSTGSTGGNTGGNTGGTSDNGFHPGSGNEATLSNYDAKSGDDTDLQESQSDAQVMDFSFDVDDADVQVQRVQVNFDYAGSPSTGQKSPWKVFTAARLLNDSGHVLATIKNIDEKSTWNKEGTNSYSIRFNGVNDIVKAGDTAHYTLELDVNDAVTNSDTSGANDWTVYIPTDGIRALDEAGIDQYIGDDSSGNTVDLSIQQGGADDTLTMSESDNNPDAQTIEVKESSRSDWETIAVMQLKAKNGDIQLNTLPFSVGTNNTATYNDVVNDLKISIDGTEYDSFDVVNGDTATASLSFDLSDEDVIVNEGDTADVEVMARFNAQSGNYDEGTSVLVDASSSAVDLIDAEDVSSGNSIGTSDLKGSFVGNEMTLRTQGLSADYKDSSATAPVGGNEAKASYEIDFTVTAFGSDFYIEKTAAYNATPDDADGVQYVIEDGAGNAYGTSTQVTQTLTADGSTSGDTSNDSGFYKVADGSSRTFHLLVTLTNQGGTAGYYRAHITGISFDLDGSGTNADGGTVTNGLEDFKTSTVYVDNNDAAN